MNVFLWNLLLAVAWSMATGEFSEVNFVVGFVIGFAALWLSRGVIGPSPYFSRVPRVIAFAGFYIRELIMSNLRVAYDVISPRPRMRPGVIGMPIDAQSDAAITLLANLITLTPGTLSLDLSADRKTLYVHVMFVVGDDIDEERRRFKADFERRVLEVLQ